MDVDALGHGWCRFRNAPQNEPNVACALRLIAMPTKVSR